MRIKPNCQLCGRPFLGGRNGYCEICATGRPPRKKTKRLRCLCGKAAVVVVLGTVLNPEGEAMEVELPLCRACRALEVELEAAEARQPRPSTANPIHVIVVKSLPRQRRGLSGRKL